MTCHSDCMFTMTKSLYLPTDFYSEIKPNESNNNNNNNKKTTTTTTTTKKAK